MGSSERVRTKDAPLWEPGKSHEGCSSMEACSNLSYFRQRLLDQHSDSCDYDKVFCPAPLCKKVLPWTKLDKHIERAHDKALLNPGNYSEIKAYFVNWYIYLHL